MQAVAVGSALGITCNWLDGSTDFSPERITTVVENEKLCWDYEGMPEFFLSTDRCIVITKISNGVVRVQNYERYGLCAHWWEQ